MFRREREENGWGQRTTVEFFAAYYLGISTAGTASDQYLRLYAESSYYKY
jgi:hypothetical protein